MGDSGEAYAMKHMAAESVSSGSDVEVRGDLKKTSRDDAEMARFGKKQQLKRNFGLMSIISLTCTLMITWEGSLAVFAGGLANGGPAGLIYGFLFVWGGNILQALVMGELASMMPLAGGQYNWVAILAPASCSKFLSYLTGWITVISWQAAVASGGYLGGVMIQGLMVISMPEYQMERWHGTLLFYAVVAFSVFINTVLARLLPHIESVVFIIHVLGFFGILIPLVYFAPHSSPKDVFTTFINAGGWSSDALSFFVGLSAGMFTFIGLDAAGHMAEEIQNASTVIPRSMMASVGVNGVLGFAMMIAVLFCLGDVESVLNTKTGFPFIQIFFNTTQSVGGTIAMSLIIIAAVIFASIGVLATGSRMMWAFAREKGLPGSSFLAKIEPRTALPLYSIGLSTLISCLLALINIGSTVAFHALTSLVIASFYTSYCLAALALLYKTYTTPAHEIVFGPFKLGRARTPIILVSLVYSVIGIFFSFWPPFVKVTPVNMNYSVVVFFGAIIISLVFWAFHGRKVYNGPIIER